MRKAGPAYKAGSSMRGAEERADELGDTVVIVRDETKRPCYCYFSAAVMRHPGQRQDRKGGSLAYKPRYQPRYFSQWLREVRTGTGGRRRGETPHGCMLACSLAYTASFYYTGRALPPGEWRSTQQLAIPSQENPTQTCPQTPPPHAARGNSLTETSPLK